MTDGNVRNKLAADGFARVRSAALVCAAALLCVVVLAACSSKPEQPLPQQHYTLQGKVLSINKERHEAMIDHKAIPGYMDAMAMPYTVPDDRVLDTLHPGDQIEATLVTTSEKAWLENIRIGKPADSAPAVAKPAESKPTKK